MAPGSKPKDVDAQKCAGVAALLSQPLAGTLEPNMTFLPAPWRPVPLWGRNGELDWSLRDPQGRREGKVL